MEVFSSFPEYSTWGNMNEDEDIHDDDRGKNKSILHRLMEFSNNSRDLRIDYLLPVFPLSTIPVPLGLFNR